jgi:iron complex outermembrane receptor protein
MILKTNTTIGQTLRVALLATTVGLGAMAFAAPAFAQDDAAASKDEGAAIVITGSRIARKDYTSNSPTVTVDEKFLSESSTAAIENQLNKLPQFVVSQSATVKNNEGGLVPAGGDIQPNSTNTPGAATVSLRGVGSNRTLVLIDGRRGTPGNASGTVDISTIPSSALERVEIVSGGASATYGADAVAGVTNFILKKNFKGFQLDAQGGVSQYGDGFEYQVSGIVGTDFADGRGNVTLAFSTNQRNRVYERDRKWYRDNWTNPNLPGSAFFIGRPGVALQAQPANANGVDLVIPGFGTFPGAPGCATNPGVYPQGCVVTNAFPGANPAVPNETTAIYANADGTLFTGDTYASRGGATFFKPGGFYPDEFNSYSLTAAGVLKDNITSNELQVPLTRYSFYGRGQYEINDWIGVFGQAMFNQSSTFTTQAPGNITGGWDVNVPWGTGRYVGNTATPSSVIRNGETGYTGATYAGGQNVGGSFVDATPGDLSDNPTNPAFRTIYGGTTPILTCANSTIGGCSNTQAFQGVVPTSIQTLLNNRTSPNAPVQLRAEFPDQRTTTTDVLSYNIIAGLQGSIPGTDWTWDLSLNQGQSITTAHQTGIYSLERTRAIVSSPNFGQNFSYKGNVASGGFGASTGVCTSGFDFFNVKGVAANVSSNCRQAIRSDLNNKGTAQQTIVEANFQGGLFDLPAGQVRGALGASYRKNSYTFLNDGLLEKDRSFLDQTIGIYPSGDTDGSITSKEIYGELLIPVLSDIPAIQHLNLEVGGRISDYSTTGTSHTFKILGDWQVTRWLRFRGGFNRAERAPNIAELFLSPQQSFGFDPVGDLCANDAVQTNVSSANPAANRGGASGAADVRAVCEALMTRDNNGVTPAPSGTSAGHPNFQFYNSLAFLQPFFSGPNGFAFPTVAGNSVYRSTIDPTAKALTPEVANTWTLGAVINGPVSAGPLSRVRMSIDYFNITIDHPIGSLSPGGMQQLCLDPAYNPSVTGAGTSATKAAAAIAAAACTLVKRDTDTNGGRLNGGAMISTYRNDGLVKLSGIDAQLDWNGPVGPGLLFLNVTGNYMFHFMAKELDPNPLIDYAGTTGTGIKGLNYGSSFRWRSFATVGYSYKGASVSMQWQHIPKTRNYNQAVDQTAAVPNYDLFNLNMSYQVTRNINARFGVDNLLNTAPKLTSVDTNLSNNAAGSVAGGSYSFFTDTLGRRFSFGVSAKF